MAAIDIQLFEHPEEAQSHEKLYKWIVAEEAFENYFEQVEEESALPDLYGKSLLVERSYSGPLFRECEKLCDLLEMDMPSLFLYDSRRCIVDSEGITKPRLEISTAALEGLSVRELAHVLAKELYHIKAGHIRTQMLATKMFSLFSQLPSLPGLNMLKSFGSEAMMGRAATTFRFLAFQWFKFACFSAERFAVCVTGDVKSSVDSVLMQIFNSRSIVNSLDLRSYIGQIGKIEGCAGPSATMEFINEVIPYGPYRLYDMLTYLCAEQADELYMSFKEAI